MAYCSIHARNTPTAAQIVSCAPNRPRPRPVVEPSSSPPPRRPPWTTRNVDDLNGHVAEPLADDEGDADAATGERGCGEANRSQQRSVIGCASMYTPSHRQAQR